MVSYLDACLGRSEGRVVRLLQYLNQKRTHTIWDRGLNKVTWYGQHNIFFFVRVFMDRAASLLCKISIQSTMGSIVCDKKQGRLKTFKTIAATLSS